MTRSQSKRRVSILKKRRGEKTYTQQQRNSTTFFHAGQKNLLVDWRLILRISIVHAFKNRAVQNHTHGTIGSHEHAASLLAIGTLANIDFESTNSTLFPFLV
jgi:hypothetical protein